MNNSIEPLRDADAVLILECVLCGKKHNSFDCDIVKICKHVPDKQIPPRAKLTLPDFLEVQMLSDGTFSVVTSSIIHKGTQFGPFQAERTQFLDPSLLFPLKIFSHDENQNYEYFLDATNEDRCSWLMYVGPAEYLEEQNLICYQEKAEIYYVAIKEIREGESLKVWYSPYYASKMNKAALPSKVDLEEPLNNVDINSLIKKQQNIMERKVWTCKFCSQIENDIVPFARHILRHYTAQHKNMCEMYKKSYGSKKHLKKHLKVVHKLYLSNAPPKLTKTIDSTSKTHCKDVALGGPLLNDIFTDSSDLQQTDLNHFDLNLDNQNLLLDNDNLNVENLLNENVKDLDHFNFEIDDNQKQFVCDICLKQFTKLNLLILHLRHHTGDFMCYKCLKIFCRNENLKSHICTISSNHPCTLCDKTFTLKKYLSRHLEAVHNKKFHCVSCNKYYYSNKELSEHNCSEIPLVDKEKHMCPICDKYFYRDSYLRKHLRTHGPVAKLSKAVDVTCEVCGLVLENRNSYYLHKKKHEIPSYGCEICDKKFCRLDTLQQHLFTHQDIKQVECSICQKKFRSKKLLTSHMRSHNNNKPFKCPKCDLNLKSRPTLNRHLRMYHGDIKNTISEYYKCPVCHKAIKLRSSLLRHLKRIHANVTNIDLSCIKPKSVDNLNQNKNKKDTISIPENNENTTKAVLADNILQKELDEQIDTLLNNAENNLSIQKHAVDSLVEELDIDGKLEKEKESREVCLSIPELTENYQEITLDKNAYILENGTIVQPQGDSDNVVIYVLDQTF